MADADPLIVEYEPGSEFPGAIGRTVEESSPAWPAPTQPTGGPDLSVGKGVPGRGQLYVDGTLAANREFPHTVPLLFELEGLSCGYDFGAPAGDGYEPPFAFTGTLHEVTFDVSGELIVDEDAELARMMAQQ